MNIMEAEIAGKTELRGNIIEIWYRTVMVVSTRVTFTQRGLKQLQKADSSVN